MVRTYAVGRNNSVVRLDDHTGPWVTLIPEGTVDTIWRDVMSDPINPDKVVIVGSSINTSLVNVSIQVSIDAGVTWTVPIGTWDTTNYLYEVWYVDTNIIWATGKDGIVVRSLDGGLTFNTVASLVGAGAYLQTAGIFALNNLVAIVLGSPGEAVTQSELYVWKTIDGGTTWVMLSGASLPPPELIDFQDIGNANGIWMSPDQQKIVVGSGYNQYLSLDGGTTWTDPLDAMERSGIHFTWFPAYDANPQYFRHVGGPVQVTESTDSGLTYSIIRSSIPPYTDPFLVIRGAHFYAPYDGYYTVDDEIFNTTDGGDTGILSHTNTILNGIYEAVWTSVEIPPFDLCYRLDDCAGILTPIYTQTDLSSHQGQVITLADDTNHEITGCWLVTATNLSCPNNVTVAVYKCHADCVSCLPCPTPIPTPTPRTVNPGYDLGVCDPEIVESAKCTFANMIYQQMMSKRYAIKYCCAPNEIDVILQKEIINMLLITGVDPTPDPCNPKCVSYEINIKVGDICVLTYTDCDDQPQVIETVVQLVDDLIEICGLDTIPPVAVVTHNDLTTDTYILEVLGSC